MENSKELIAFVLPAVCRAGEKKNLVKIKLCVRTNAPRYSCELLPAYVSGWVCVWCALGPRDVIQQTQCASM